MTDKERFKKQLLDDGFSYVRDNRRDICDSYSFYLLNKHYYYDSNYRNNITQLLWLCDYREHMSYYTNIHDDSYEGGCVLYVKHGKRWTDPTSINDDLHNLYFYIMSPIVLDHVEKN